jgi:uncharacterized membrane protein
LLLENEKFCEDINKRTPDGKDWYIHCFVEPDTRLLDRLAERRNRIGGFRAKANTTRTPASRFADWLARQVGTIPFLVMHIGLFVFWFAVNMRLVNGTQPFDVYPFGLLTMLLTLEQSLLTIFIIIS